MITRRGQENCEVDASCSRKNAWCGNKEEITLIWLTRTDFSSKDGEGEIILKHLHEINNYVKAFDNPSTCIDYMKSIKDEQIFLIVDGKFIADLYENIHACRAVDSIYIFCIRPEKYEHLRNRPRIAGYLA
jgi:hypothetical protein